ncbi:hypothetical protein PG2113B_0127 [Bifidobacterium pseudolongum subsp. globosum]|uniref:hypothetical protein n=1 Tax=Bifidobacterium pseudolongum TaxID=1694 RepID=UPI001022495A|nr:hypothetical protein [Bifidobacterium pseudolongum]RYQ05786.1 hypothetical protein PG2113B_0127 [Bifidobacterium pseudolongum subsp. globosum]RYQ10664.1 hypothetical protein PG2098B_0126 [Bifidobacterium pseudolongum subsp. globosum]RYQ14997.1 hypothetical protein PG2088B_0126 [Bifidobacterium pseudolongum subsp. globosum]RYQ17186.1 hypothetical protein PG2086B_0126 [Bifidobacterium pseudolongum subsp. globosum]
MNSNYFENLRALWLAHGGEPDKELHPEDHGRYVAARMAEARRPDSKLSEFDEWARRERREQDAADDLHGVRVALERIATTLEHGHGEPEVAPKAMRSLPVDPDATIEGAYVRKPSIDLNMGLYGFGGVYRDERGASWFAMELDPEFKADSPDDLRDVAALFRDNYADALEWIADEWAAQLDAGEVHLLEPDNDDDIADEDNELED